MKQGKAETSKTASVAGLILLIFFFLIGYLVLLPSEERAELLDIKIEDKGDELLEEGAESILVKTPGYLGPYALDKEEKELGSISLYSTMEQESDLLGSRLYVSRNIFSNNYQDMNFKLEDVYDLTALGLFFNVVSGKGKIIVRLNENNIYQGQGTSFDLPINLPLNFLKYNNKLTIMASSPGLNIFRSNYYELRDVSLVKTEKFVNKEEVRMFSVDKEQMKSDGKLEFYVNCLKVGKAQGILEVSLNERNIFTKRIGCDTGKNMVEVRKEYFKDGENSLKFEIDRGDYKIEDLNLEYSIKTGENPMYYFSIDEEDLYKEFELRLLFGRGELKRAMIILNGEEISMISEEEEWVKDISGYLDKGENYIKIIPKNEFEITHLEIVLLE